MNAPTRILYHKIFHRVNAFYRGQMYFYEMHHPVSVILWNIPTCILRQVLLLYKYKEVIPMI